MRNSLKRTRKLIKRIFTANTELTIAIGTFLALHRIWLISSKTVWNSFKGEFMNGKCIWFSTENEGIERKKQVINCVNDVLILNYIFSRYIVKTVWSWASSTFCSVKWTDGEENTKRPQLNQCIVPFFVSFDSRLIAALTKERLGMNEFINSVAVALYYPRRLLHSRSRIYCLIKI